MGNRETHQAGLFAETIAAVFVMCKGWSILNRRFKTPVGEIDIIAKRGKTITFIEVKRRATMDDALGAVSPENASRVRRAAEWWLKGHQSAANNCDLRFDVVALSPYARIRHIPNAF